MGIVYLLFIFPLMPFIVLAQGFEEIGNFFTNLF